MNGDTERVRAYLTRSMSFAEEMELLIKEGYSQGAVDRAYYAIFHMAQALLASVGLEFTSHEAVIAAFGREFAKTKKLDPNLHRILRQAFDLRLTADYDVEVTIDEATAQDLLKDCRHFLKVVNAFLPQPTPPLNQN